MAEWMNGYACFGNFSESGGKEKRQLEISEHLRKVYSRELGGQEQPSRSLRK